MLYIINLTDIKLEHAVTLDTTFVNQLHCRLNTSSRYAIFKSLPFCGCSAIRKWVWEGEIFWQETKLTQDSSLVPSYVFVVQSVASDVDYGSEGYATVLACWWDARYPSGVSVWEHEPQDRSY